MRRGKRCILVASCVEVNDLRASSYASLQDLATSIYLASSRVRVIRVERSRNADLTRRLRANEFDFGLLSEPA